MSPMVRATRRLRSAALLCLALTLAACGARDKADSVSPGGTQVVAKVNGSELTLSQLNLLLNKSAGGASDTRAVRSALDELIQQELLVQQAKSDKLDRDPDVMLRMEQARRQVLAEAYAERSIYPAQPVPEAELRAFYDSHPELFGARRVFTISAFLTDKTKLNEAVTTELPRVHDEATLHDLLTRNGVSSQVERLQEGADGLPLDLAPQLATAVPGMVLQTTHKSGTQVALFLVLGATSSPQSFEQAHATITNYLTRRRDDRALTAWVAGTRRGARVEYLGKLGAVAAATEKSSGSTGLNNLR